MIERILVPLDGSPGAERILSQVARILRRQDTEVLLLRVVDTVQAVDDVNQSAFLPPAREEAQAYLEDLRRRLFEEGVRVRARVAEGPVAASILDVAREERSTLLAMSTHGRSGLARWVLGSVAEKVARSSEIPLLLLRTFGGRQDGAPEPLGRGEIPFRRILVPLDGSETSAAVLPAAEEFARLFGSEVLLLHVWPAVVTPVQVLPGATVYQTALPKIPASDQDPVTAGAAENLRKSGVSVLRRTTSGDAAAEILDEAHSGGADLIALATHGRSGLQRWALGSVAERVLRHARVPILLVRSAGVAAR